MVAYTIDKLKGNYSTHVDYKKVCMNDAIVIFLKYSTIIVAVADLSFRMASLHHRRFHGDVIRRVTWASGTTGWQKIFRWRAPRVFMPGFMPSSSFLLFI